MCDYKRHRQNSELRTKRIDFNKMLYNCAKFCGTLSFAKMYHNAILGTINTKSYIHSGLPQWGGGRSEGDVEICSNCEIFNTGRSMELISANRTLFLTVLSCVEVV